MNETNDQNPWRPLEPGEIIQQGDECRETGGVWETAHRVCTGIPYAPNEGEEWRTRRPRPVPATDKDSLTVQDSAPAAPTTLTSSEYKYLGNYSAVEPAYSRDMYCDDCRVRWTGCWDNFMCPQCGKGELPSCEPCTLEKIEVPAAPVISRERCESCGTMVDWAMPNAGATSEAGKGAGGGDQQTAREWAKHTWDAMWKSARFSWQFVMRDLIAPLADRADRAEAELKQCRYDLDQLRDEQSQGEQYVCNLKAERDAAMARNGAALAGRDAFKAECEVHRSRAEQASQIASVWEGRYNDVCLVKTNEMLSRKRAEAERDALRAQVEALMVEHVKAIRFIKELNATKFEHGRQYRSRCGKFLAALKTTNTNDQ